MIEQRIIEQVIDNTDIVDVAGRYTELKKKGANWEGCCPFHKERTPSFKVSPSKGIWTCFGACQESGNVISLVMRAESLSFPEAVRKLAGELNIVIDDHQPTAEEIKTRHHRESMLAVIAHAAGWFRAQMETEEGAKAKAYVTKRWGVDMMVKYGIGYAPASFSAFVDWGLEAGLDASLMEETGLVAPRKTGGYYSVFRERVMIPIRDRAGQTIGFTARYIGTEDGVPKYINSRDSVVYKKGESVFGIDFAKRTATREGKFYLVEGGPDVLKLQSIEVDNTVASLGTAWTDKQFAALKKFAPAVCFIPDADPPREGQAFGTGIEKVMKNGAAALAAGLSVSVIEIPLGEGCTKADPDTWFNSRAKLHDAEEVDFIPWYAAKRLVMAGGTDGQSQVVKDVAGMVAATGDEVREKMYIAQLGKLLQGRSLWAQAVAAAKKTRAEQEEAREGDKGRRLLSRYGFYERGGCYFAMTEKGDVQWSNFTLKPLFHIKDPITAKRLFVARNFEGQEVFIEIKQADMVNLAAFQTVMESAGNFIWMAGGKELTKLKAYLYENTQTAEEVTQFGWHSEGFYVFGNGILQNGVFHEGDDFGIVHLDDGAGNYYIPAMSKLYAKEQSLFRFERQFVAVRTQDLGLADYFRQLAIVYGDTGRVAMAWLVATCFRDIIVRKTRFFPLLNVFGPKGTGKSELALALMAIFQTRTTLTFLTNSSRPALAETVAQVANAPVHLEEYKNSIGFEKIEFLKGIWDGQGRSRMNMDRDKRKETSKVDSGVVITGQEIPTADIALFSRLVFLMLNKTSFSNAERAEFETLRKMKEAGVTHLSLELLNYRPLFEQEFVAAYNNTCNDFYEYLKDNKVEDRIINNWAIVAAAVKVLDKKKVLPYNYTEIKTIALQGIIEQNKFCRQNNDTANFWGIVAYLQQDGYIYNGADYKIKVVTSLQVEGRNINWDDPHEILLLRKSRVIALYRKYGAQVGDNILPTPTIESYLKYSAEFLGRKRSERFKLIQQGREVTQRVEQDGGAAYKPTSSIDQALCFDYAALVSNYGINLRVDTQDGDDD